MLFSCATICSTNCLGGRENERGKEREWKGDRGGVEKGGERNEEGGEGENKGRGEW